ncbi:MAG TPA: arginine--tRNA ligase [Candidatus Paceibacterota bacterium]|nr:arginine--tRNA ligase [Candidatus Paceibacterota bacterium]
MDIQTKIQAGIQNALKALGLSVPEGISGISLEHPADVANGDYATNVAMALAKAAKTNPRELANRIAEAVRREMIEYVERVEVAGPGFINFYLTKRFFSDELALVLKRKDLYGSSNEWRGRKMLVEYTDPNPFKEFHIGHLMSNAIGESISRLVASQGAKVRRMCYQGDFGMHVAKALWAVARDQERMPAKRAPLSERIAFIGACYVAGSKAYEEDAAAKAEIEAINKKVFEGKDRKLMKLYKLGRKWSLAHFEDIYEKLGTKFDYYYLESEVAHDGMALVEEYLEKGIFEKSDGAIVFKGEKYDPKLHTRVFVNSQGIPTYETKELGLNTKKWKKVRPDLSIIITANEQNDYFRVVLKALELIEPEAAKVTQHISHGMLRFVDGKMSSRKGNVITGESLLSDVEALVHKKLEGREMSDDEKAESALAVAVAAIKYSILRQATASDIIYDFDKSISFEGDSGPYILYTAVRAQSVLDKAKKERVKAVIDPRAETHPIARHIARMPEVVSYAANEKAPHLVATFLIELAALFNSWYGNVQIVNKDDAASPHRVAIAEAARIALANGAKLLGMTIPERM